MHDDIFHVETEDMFYCINRECTSTESKCHESDGMRFRTRVLGNRLRFESD